MKNKLIITAVLFLALAAAAVFAASNGNSDGLLPPFDTEKALEEVKGEFSNEFLEIIETDANALSEESSVTAESITTITETEPETTIP